MLRLSGGGQGVGRRLLGDPLTVQKTLEDRVPHADGTHFNHLGVALVRWDQKYNVVLTEWQGWANPAEFAAVLEAGLRAIKEHQSSRGLVDCLRQRVVQQSDQDWVNQSWFPRALAAGLTRLALVIPKSGLTMMNIRDVLGKVSDTKLDTAYFSTVDEALRWLTRPTSDAPNGRAPNSTA